MEINESSLIVFYVGRIFGYAPYRIKRIGSGKSVPISSSVILKLYSLALLTTLVISCIAGLIRDARTVPPLRMKSTTSIVATSLDVNIVVASCLFGVISGTIGLRQTQEVNRRLKEEKNDAIKFEHFIENVSLTRANRGIGVLMNEKLDDILFIYIGQDNSAKTRGIKLVFPTFAAILSILAMDIYGWYRQALKITETNNAAVNIVNNLYCYIPFYILYVFLMTLQIQFAHTSWGLGTRYRRLNYALNNIFLKEKSFSYKKNVGFTTAAINEYRKNENVTNAVRRARVISLENIYLKRFAYIHESLGKAFTYISRYFGMPLLMLTSSCLLHLTVTAYFLVLSILDDENEVDPFHISLQALWLVFHTFRLLLIVEPCNLTTVELESFWQQLLADETHFTAAGFCKIDRSILTTLMVAITTYLVILLQFEKIYG